LSEGIKCPKCGIKLNSKLEFEKHTKGLNDSDILDPVLEVTAKNWEETILQSKFLVVVEFWHESCPSCKKLAPIYIEVAKEYKDKIKFAKLNVLTSKDNRDIAVKYGLMSTPTLIFFCDGKPIATKVGRKGFETKERLKQLINDMLNKCPEDKEKNSRFQK
jgi:thioredoxin 1